VGLLFWSSSGQMPTWKDFHPDAIETFQKFRTPKVGEEMILEATHSLRGSFFPRQPSEY
jgi:haloalkane dehalogenase